MTKSCKCYEESITANTGTANTGGDHIPSLYLHSVKEFNMWAQLAVLVTRLSELNKNALDRLGIPAKCQATHSDWSFSRCVYKPISSLPSSLLCWLQGFVGIWNSRNSAYDFMSTVLLELIIPLTQGTEDFPKLPGLGKRLWPNSVLWSGQDFWCTNADLFARLASFNYREFHF